MSTVPKQDDLLPKGCTPATNAHWSVKQDIKNAIIDYKSYTATNNSEWLEKGIMNKLYCHFKEGRSIGDCEEVTLGDTEMFGFTTQELRICIDTISSILMGLVKITFESTDSGCIITLTLQK